MTATDRPVSLTATGCPWPSGMHDMHDMYQGKCTRCAYTDEVKTAETPVSDTVNEKFESLLDAEALVRSETAGVLFAGNGTPMYLLEAKHRNLAKARAALYAMVDELSPEDMQAYAEYRRRERAAAESAEG